MPISTFGTIDAVGKVKDWLSNLNENDIDAFSDSVDRSGVVDTLPGGQIAHAMMPLAIAPAAKMGTKLIQMLNKSRLAKVASRMPAFRYQEEMGKDFASQPGRGSIFATIGDIADRMHPNYDTGFQKGLPGEGGTNFVSKMVQPQNPLMVADVAKEGIGANTLRAMQGEKFTSQISQALANANTPDEALEIARKFGKFNNNDLRNLAQHTAMNAGPSTAANVSRMALIRDAMAAKEGKFYGFDSVLPNSKNKRQASEMMLLK